MAKQLIIRDPLAKTWVEGEKNFHLDVRPVLSQGGEPFSTIMACVKQLAVEDLITIHAPFEPVPLVNRLRQMGFEVKVEKAGLDHWTLQAQKKR